MLNFTALDFETANSYPGSPCTVGLVKVRDGKPVHQGSWLIHPPEGADHFDSWNSATYGITAEIVADVPRWREMLPGIADFIGKDVVVSHSAGFDVGVIRYACAQDNIECPDIRFLCTQVMAQEVLSLPSNQLPAVAAAFDHQVYAKRGALAEAYAVTAVVGGLAAHLGVNDISGLAAAAGVKIGYLKGGIYRGCAPMKVGAAESSEGYLRGRVVAVTGALQAMTRAVALQECRRVGAIPAQTVTKATNVLVVAGLETVVQHRSGSVSAKIRGAFQSHAEGRDIELLTETDFLRCLQGEVPLDQHKQPLPQLPAPQNNKLPRPLRLPPEPTDQICDIVDCGARAAYGTRTRAGYCLSHIEEMQLLAGLRPLESFTRPNDWQLTECLTCATVAHYRFNHIMGKMPFERPICGACYWRQWAAGQRQKAGPRTNVTPIPGEEAKAFAETQGFEYLGPLTAPSFRGDPHLTRCCRCGKISAQRLADIGFGCSCQPKGKVKHRKFEDGPLG